MSAPGPTLVDTGAAAEAVGVAASGFRSWARRRGLDPVERRRVGRRFVAYYDLRAVLEAERDTPTARGSLA